jgi:RNA recognition motif-containing protein
MMDRTTGKTLSDAYVEFLTVADMRRAIDTRNQKPLKGRIVSVTECSQEELLAVVFPKWRGRFQGTSAIPPATEVVRTMSTAAGGGSSGCPPFITREEINSLLVVCKNYKVNQNRNVNLISSLTRK